MDWGAKRGTIEASRKMMNMNIQVSEGKDLDACDPIQLLIAEHHSMRILCPVHRLKLIDYRLKLIDYRLKLIDHRLKWIDYRVKYRLKWIDYRLK